MMNQPSKLDKKFTQENWMGWILYKARSFWAWVRGLNFFGQVLPSLLTCLLFVTLVFHISFEAWGAMCEAIRIGDSSSEIVLTILSRTIQEISSSTVRNLILFLVASVSWLFFYWQRNRFRKWANDYWHLEYRTFWEPLILSVIVAGIFIWVFLESLKMMNQNAVRNLILLTAGIIGWYFLYQRTKTADQSREAAEKSANTAEQDLTTERLTRAINQLAHENPSVRLGGILGLEQIAETQKEERMKIARILVSFIRTRATKDSKESEKDLDATGLSKLVTQFDFSTYREQRLDIEAAVKILANISSELEEQGQFQEKYDKMKYHLCDLQNIDLQGLRFVETDLSKFNFAGANMSGAWLTEANLSGAFLYTSYVKEGAKLMHAFLENTNFSGAHLNFADFRHAHLEITNFAGARLHNANFSGVQMTKIDFRYAVLEEVNFTGAILYSVNIDGAELKNANFTDAKLENVYGLLQWKLDEAFRWKGHHTQIAYTDGFLLEPPPEREKSIQENESEIDKDNNF